VNENFEWQAAKEVQISNRQTDLVITVVPIERCALIGGVLRGTPYVACRDVWGVHASQNRREWVLLPRCRSYSELQPVQRD
jgi:hypothetical protein